MRFICFRVFRLRLRRDSKIFADDVEFEATGHSVNFDPSVVYSGTLEGKIIQTDSRI